MKRIDRQILHIALPSIVSNITVPLLGLVDVTIVGHLGSAAYIGAIAVGGMLFNIIYWIFGFLRMGTSGMTSQLYGRRDWTEATRMLTRAVGIGVGVGICFIVLQVPVREIAFLLVHPTDEVRQLATTYFHICIWGAPAMLGLYGLTGWFIGMQNSRIPMTIAITQNIVNIAASLWLVYGGGLKVEGVALGTLIAQYAGFFMGIGLCLHYYGRLRTYFRWKGLWERSAMSRFFAVNRDIFLRTLCLVAVTLFFTSTGAKPGEMVLAVNTLLIQLFTLYSYVMDGFAYAGEALSGKYIGTQNQSQFSLTVRHLFAWGGEMALLFTLAYAIGGNAFLGLLTDEPEVLEASQAYFYWTLVIPLAGVAAFLWDGIYIGATSSLHMLYSMAISSALFFITDFGLENVLGNHALWLAFLLYLFSRGIVLTGYAPKHILRKVE